MAESSVTRQWFGDRLVSPQDRLDSRGKYFPFGQERTNITPPNPANDQEKFASYTRDSATGLDYADQRYYNNLVGRFMRPDPFGGSANPNVPQTWNRYVYAGNDPANNFDPEGLFLVDCVWDGCPGLHGEGGGGGGDYSGSVAPASQIDSGALTQSQQQSEGQYSAALQQTTTDVSYANAANQAVANGNPGFAALLASADSNIQAVPVAPTTPDPVYNAYASMAPSLGIDPNTEVPVIYQQQGVGMVIQPLDPWTKSPYQLSDLSFNPSSVGVSDPGLVSAFFHGTGNSSWYIGGETNAIHLANLQNVQDQPGFLPGLQFHVDAYNPTFGLPSLFQHFGSEVMPGGRYRGPLGTTFCSISGRCQ